MAFKIYSTDDNRVPGIEYLPASAITPKVGMALTQTTGQLALATGATAPTYISMCEKDSECTAGDIIPVIRVGKDMILETMFPKIGDPQARRVYLRYLHTKDLVEFRLEMQKYKQWREWMPEE